ncbi:hypothetical protein [Hyunsoonleella pacifica]|uniref:Cadherin domain-containing protein n=1 Tax=Hyunsoonleella pacifica TaxID=1080224 RepID=A0A4Q9FST2_9FLAO|nr:hypothetical protein [Hyunsoonleella pacifica]TBN18760.1 hypothetical protein EYD46_01465 [Hyunsoonleella pacifica]GGD04513.1 hypothetical protein GCM10011368_02940 [Hyunsoonleella pacifica]
MKIVYKYLASLLVIVMYVSCNESDDSVSGVTVNTEDFTITAPVVVQQLDTLGFSRGTSNSGEVTFTLLSQNPENSVVLGVRFGEIIAATPEVFNSGNVNEITLQVQVRKKDVSKISNITILRNLNDPDGDGVENSRDSDPNNPCLPLQDLTYTGFNPFNSIWGDADCDEDGMSNADEVNNGRNPYIDESTIGDADGDGVRDDVDPEPNNPCLPEQFSGYQDFNPDNEVWAMGDCDDDGITNADELANGDSPYPLPDLPCNEILNFDLGNYERELRTVDSNNGEGVTIGVLGEECGTFLFTGGSLFNQGCFNDDLVVPFFFTPNDPTSSNGSIVVDLTEYSCLSEDRVSTREFTVEGFGTYAGASSTVEFTYTITQLGDDIPDEERVTTGTLIIRPLS